MRLTQAQLRELVGVTEETFRTWRGKFPSLGRGKGDTFSLGEALAIAMVKDAVRGLGIKVGQLSAMSPELFEVCERAVEVGAAEYLLIDAGGATPMAAGDTLAAIDPPGIVLGLRAGLDRLRDAMLKRESNQIGLPF